MEEDRSKPGHFYAYVDDFLEFEHAVPFRVGKHYYEAGLMKADGSTSKGAFGRSARLLSDTEFEAILHAGFARELEPWERTPMGVAEPPPAYAERPISKQVIMRPFRDAAFRRRVRQA